LNQRSVLFRELRAPELRALASPATVVIVPVAAMEQHGPHLPVGTDAMLGAEVARRAAELLAAERPALVTDTAWAGLSEHHMAFGATISLDFPAFFSLLRGIVVSLHRHGFRRILLLNSHGGNVAALQTVVEEITRELQLPLVGATYWTLAQGVLGPMLDRQKGIRHACEAETSMIMALRPELVDEAARLATCEPDPRDGEPSGDDGYRWMSFAEKTPSGVLGDPTAASAAKGEKLLDAAARHLASQLRDETFWGPRGRGRSEGQS